MRSAAACEDALRAPEATGALAEVRICSEVPLAAGVGVGKAVVEADPPARAGAGAGAEAAIRSEPLTEVVAVGSGEDEEGEEADCSIVEKGISMHSSCPTTNAIEFADTGCA